MRYVYLEVIDEDEAILDMPAFPEIVCTITPEDRKLGRIPAIAYDAVKNALQARIDYNDEIPEPASERGDGLHVTLAPLDVLKLTLYEQFRKRDCTRSEFAKLVSATPTTLSRALDLYHASRYEVISEMLNKLGLEVRTEIKLAKKS
jgi:hypothetical protein